MGKKKTRKCTKQRYRDYFIESDGCRSKRPYKMAKCVGGGGNSCVANKTILRKIRFVCKDDVDNDYDADFYSNNDTVTTNRPAVLNDAYYLEDEDVSDEEDVPIENRDSED